MLRQLFCRLKDLAAENTFEIVHWNHFLRIDFFHLFSGAHQRYNILQILIDCTLQKIYLSMNRGSVINEIIHRLSRDPAFRTVKRSLLTVPVVNMPRQIRLRCELERAYFAAIKTFLHNVFLSRFFKS